MAKKENGYTSAVRPRPPMVSNVDRAIIVNPDGSLVKDKDGRSNQPMY